MLNASDSFHKLKARACSVKVLITDVDGVLTDGKFFYSNDGKVLKQFGAHDSDGLKLLRSMGVMVKAITADKRRFSITKRRLDDMGLSLELVSEIERLNWMKQNCLSEQTAFVGDGIHDAAVMKWCNFSFAPKNAVAFAKKHATQTLEVAGGEGVLLEVALQLLKLRNIEQYSKLEAFE